MHQNIVVTNVLNDENPNQLAAWFVVVFFLGVLKLSVSETSDHDFNSVVRRIYMQTDALLMPHMQRREEGFEEHTDFRIRNPAEIIY